MIIDEGVVKDPDTSAFEGFFTYDAAGESKKISFRLEVWPEDGSFSGFATDEETKDLFDIGTILVKGFIEDGLISFVKTYPNRYSLDEYGKAEISDPDKPHPVEYFGVWDDREEKYAGEYTVTVSERIVDRYKGKYGVETYSGYWEMKPVESALTFRKEPGS
jgi:hypothetical protein